jgi:hypothetical protein
MLLQCTVLSFRVQQRITFALAALALMSMTVPAFPQTETEDLAKLGMLQNWLLRCPQAENHTDKVEKHVAYITRGIDKYGERKVIEAMAVMSMAMKEFGAQKFCDDVTEGLGLQ